MLSGLSVSFLEVLQDRQPKLIGGVFLGSAFLHPHDDGVGLGLVSDGLQAGRQGARGTGFADGGLNVGEQDRRVEGEDANVGIIGRADHAHDCGRDGADGAATIVEFDDPHAIEIIGHAVPVRCLK